MSSEYLVARREERLEVVRLGLRVREQRRVAVADRTAKSGGEVA